MLNKNCLVCHRRLTEEIISACNLRNSYYICIPCCANKKQKEEFKLKCEVMYHYGGHCVLCGETNIKLLQLDHVDGNGAIHRIESKMGGGSLYRKLKRDNYQCNYNLKPLCITCNFLKGVLTFGRLFAHINKIKNYLRKQSAEYILMHLGL